MQKSFVIGVDYGTDSGRAVLLDALTGEQIENLRALMPECEMFLEPHAESTGGGWRDHPRYFEMRDIFEMYYMPGGTNGVDEFGQQIIIPG